MIATFATFVIVVGGGGVWENADDDDDAQNAADLGEFFLSDRWWVWSDFSISRILTIFVKEMRCPSDCWFLLLLLLRNNQFCVPEARLRLSISMAASIARRANSRQIKRAQSTSTVRGVGSQSKETRHGYKQYEEYDSSQKQQWAASDAINMSFLHKNLQSKLLSYLCTVSSGFVGHRFACEQVLFHILRAPGPKLRHTRQKEARLPCEILLPTTVRYLQKPEP